MTNTDITDNIAGAAIISNDQSYNLRKLMIERNYPEYLKLAEDCISQNFALAKGTEFAFYEKSQNDGILLDGANALRPILFRKATQYSYSTLCLLKNGHIEATYSCMRSCVEHIWRIYFLTLAEEEQKVLLYKLEINKDREPATLPEAKRLTTDETTKIKNDFKYFSPGYIKKYLYTKDKYLSMEKLYGGFSTKTHPSINGSSAEMEFWSESVEDLLKLLISLSLSLMVVGLEIYPKDISSCDDERMKRLVARVGETLGSLPDLFPNNSDFTQRLRVRVETTKDQGTTLVTSSKG